VRGETAQGILDAGQLMRDVPGNHHDIRLELIEPPRDQIDDLRMMVDVEIAGEATRIGEARVAALADTATETGRVFQCRCCDIHLLR